MLGNTQAGRPDGKVPQKTGRWGCPKTYSAPVCPGENGYRSVFWDSPSHSEKVV